MTQENKKKKLLTLPEVEDILEESLKKPSVIYTGPEEDNNTPEQEEEESQSEESEEGEEKPKSKFRNLSFEKRATIDHIRAFKRIDKDKSHDLVEELMKIDRVTPEHAYKILELAPRDEVELRPIFAKDRFDLSPEELKQIIESVDKYRI